MVVGKVSRKDRERAKDTKKIRRREEKVKRKMIQKKSTVPLMNSKKFDIK